ncbi:MAG: pyrroline-5-carboxylate reductase [Chitinivibrionales bacterium]|nr:pyrroline-5-carboxylate reductase [Chitinivibrionales bacterium]MBD3396159.1 pyrroline-5-carboxylate reductase [Chitinivibrionales bacterium]
MKLAVLGCGNMGSALIAGLRTKLGTRARIAAYDKRASAMRHLPRTVSKISPADWFKNGSPDVVVLAVKPQDMSDALADVTNAIGEKAVGRTLWLSIAAGISLAKLQKLLGTQARICRAMPNTPALIGQGITAYTMNTRSTKADAKKAEVVLGSVGQAVLVPEKMMDAVTGLSGSGPAYVYTFIEALIEGGTAAGLTPEVARQCAIQTVVGAGNMVARSNETPAVLRARVVSPGGTTEAGLKEMAKYGMKNSVVRAVRRAAMRSVELGKK